MRFKFVPFNYSREKNILWKCFLKCFKTFYKIHVLLKNFKMLLVEDIKFWVKLKKQTISNTNIFFMRFYPQFFTIFLPSITFWSCLLKLMQDCIKLTLIYDKQRHWRISQRLYHPDHNVVLWMVSDKALGKWFPEFKVSWLVLLTY